MNNKEIVDMLHSLFLIRGYTLVQTSDQSTDIVIQNDSHSQSISLFNLARQIEQLESPQEAKKCLHSFVEKVCEQFRIRKSAQSTTTSLVDLFPFFRNKMNDSDALWYAPFDTIENQISFRIQFPNSETLVWHLVHNRKSHVKILNVFDIPKLQISSQSAWQQAIQNLKSTTKEPENWGDGWFCFHQNDGFDATRLLVIEDFIDIKKDMVFAVPCRDLLAVAPLSQRTEMSRWAVEYFHSYPYPISNKVGFLSPPKSNNETKHA